MSDSAETQAKRLDILDILRGLAALSVCLYHFKDVMPVESIIKYASSYGRYGVEVFFVLSGFVVPMSLTYKSALPKYSAIPFLIGRLGRVYLPFISAFIITILLNKASSLAPGFQGNVVSIDWQLIYSHLLMMGNEFGQKWVNPVFWTLAVEFQFYLVCAVVVTFPERFRVLVISTIIGILTLANNIYFLEILHWAPFFIAGYSVLVVRRRKFLGYILLVASMISICMNNGFAPVLASMIAVISIFLSDVLQKTSCNRKTLLFMGSISYSLYLLHVPVGGKLCNLLERWSAGPIEQYGVVLIATLCSIFAAYIHYRYIELSCTRVGKKLQIVATARLQNTALFSVGNDFIVDTDIASCKKK